ncbi:MAG: NADH-quinone oxidoreductase subunit NuoG [Actinomycetota bacterium]|nr:NADH-quinone oxidoreductase subunit NuoG [Actinomycetota bacterium]
MSERKTVRVSIDGRDAEVEEGRMLIDVAEEMGIFVPRFCYHPGMKSVAVCRMCLVAVEGQKKLVPSCATPVADEMNVNTVEEEAVDAQRGMLEFLLINHPLDCPICDRAGECPLQDQTFRHGPGATRYVEPKRTYEKPIDISNLVVLDRERCVLCWRCVRFADEIAGDQFIQLVDRGPGTQILTFKDDPFDSYFSGNTVQICPVGALTSKPYRFVSRPWNLKSAPSVCSYCAVGCPVSNESRSGKLVRVQALPNENVNDFWVCDKGRYGYHFVDSEERLSSPLVRGDNDEFELTSWGRALEEVASKLSDGDRVGVIAGGHLTTEDAFAIGRLARKTIKTTHVDSRIQDAGAPYDMFLELGVAGSTATLNDLETASSIVWIGPDPKETLPVLYLRLRKAVLDLDAQLAVVSPRRISLDYMANHIVRTDPEGIEQSVSSLEDGGFELGDNPVVCWGPAFAGRDEAPGASAAIALARSTGAKVLVCPPHAGSQSMVDMGVLPSLQAGYKVAPEGGRDTRAILETAANGELDALLIFGAELVSDFPDAGLVERALQATYSVVVELLPTDTVAYANVVLPSTAYAEREGTFTNLERRLQKLEPSVPPPGSASDPWRICGRLAAALGDKWGWNSCDDLWAALRKEVPTYADVDLTAISQPAPVPRPEYGAGWQGDPDYKHPSVAGPGGQYPKGFRAGAPFQTGQNWPLSWELRAFEARQRPGFIPSVNGNGAAPPADGGPEVTSSGGVPESSEERASNSFTLLAGRLIYDEGSMLSKTAALRAIAARPFVEISEGDAARLELQQGEDALVSANGFEARLRVVVSDIADGCVFVPYDQQGLRANRLMSGVNPTVEVAKA